MDMNTLRAALREGVGYLPQEYKDKAGKFVMDVMDGMEKVSDVLDETVMDLADARPSTSIYDDVRKDVGNPPNSFDDIVAGFSQPDAESGGSENYLLIASVVETLANELGVPSFQTVKGRAALYEKNPNLIGQDIGYLNSVLTEKDSGLRLSYTPVR